MEDYSISFNLNEDDGFRLPVNPAKIEVKEGGETATYDIAALGEISVIKSPKLPEISFEGLFPAQDYPFVIEELKGQLREPLDYVRQIELWMKQKQPVRFVFAGSSKDYHINELVSIENFTWHESAGAVGDIEYSIALKRYIEFSAKKITGLAPAPKAETRPDNRKQPKTYTLKAGDTLWKVAKMFLGNGARYPEIQKLNNIPDSQLKRLPIGMVLKLPD